MPISFFNTLTGHKEAFTPLTEGRVGLYTCGPTVYDFAHIGNFRAYIFEDLLRRFLELSGYEVTQVMNITDVDDKTIQGALREQVPLNVFTEKYIQAFEEDLALLRIQRPQVMPRATEHIPQMIRLIEMLLAKGYAYHSLGSVYFKTETFPSYGRLSKKDLEKNRDGARVDHDEYDKEEASDFVLWKEAKPGEPVWQSPFGQGRPGWHIECSAMSTQYLGNQFDIHTGGEDNIFPHHENEIAQSECATGEPFVRYWLHCRFLLVNGEKMSKSKGNFYTLRDLLAKGYDPVSVRYLLLTHHYRHPLNFTLEGLEQAKKAIQRINQFYERIESLVPGARSSAEFIREVSTFQESFLKALADDLNISAAMGIFFDFLKRVNHEADQSAVDETALKMIKDFLVRVERVLAVKNDTKSEAPQRVVDLTTARELARKERRFQDADRLRGEIEGLGWIIKDTPDGPKLSRA